MYHRNSINRRCVSFLLATIAAGLIGWAAFPGLWREVVGQAALASSSTNSSGRVNGAEIAQASTAMFGAPRFSPPALQDIPTAAAATVTVNSTTDISDGDTSSIAALTATPGPDGVISLREAIIAANNTVGADVINFNIAGAGVKTIVPLSLLPTITSPVTIDGYTQPGSSANTLAVGDNSVHLIELNGNSALVNALTITAGSSTVRGLVINRFNSGSTGASAIRLEAMGNNKVEGCFLGLNTSGLTATGISPFALLIVSSPNNMIGGTTPATRNVALSSQSGISINNPASSGTTIQGNYIGVNAPGTAGFLSGGVSLINTGVSIGGGTGTGSSNNLIGGTTAGARNVISGTQSHNIMLNDSDTTGNVIQGNYIGTNATGTASGSGTGNGITLLRTSGVTIGGTTTGAGNLISGNSGVGILITNESGPSRTIPSTIQGNLIGTNAAGTAAVTNSIGVQIAAGQKITVGGTAAGARNIISAGTNHGLVIQDSDNLVQGNFIGTDINGTAKLGNAGDGVIVSGLFGLTVTGVTIGGTTAAARNIISGNGLNGIDLGAATTTVIQGNFIGTDVNGTGNLGNAQIGISLNSVNNTIGGVSAGAGNIIAFNGSAPGRYDSSGVVLTGFSTGISIRGNSIFSNAALGINLSGGTENTSGVTANDSCDADDGANHLQNFPVITSAMSAGGSTTIVGSLNSTASTTFTIDFYSNPACDESGNGEGKTYLGSAQVTTDSGCNATINAVLPVSLAAGQVVTATATDPANNTSEFSSCATAATAPPTVQFNAANYDVTEDCTFVTLTVTRSGDTSGTSTVDFATADGGALQRTDYTLGSGTVTFASTETLKTFSLLITEDHYVEGAEQFSVTLSNPTGAALGVQSGATVTINDDDTAQAPSPAGKSFGGSFGGGNESPTNNSPATGRALVDLSADETTALVSLSFSGLSSAQASAHIHGPAARGVNAPVLFPLAAGNFNSFQINLTTSQVADLRAGLLYANVHSANFPNGEIRAQLEFNPIDSVSLFVGQHYHDFLSRQADSGGQAYWEGQVTQCGNNAACVRDRRVDVSNAFYYELEFQQTGSYVYRVYRAAYGNNQPFPNPNPDPAHPGEQTKVPLYLPFMKDRARVRGGAQLAQLQLDLATIFVQRAEFLAKYPASLMTAAQFVDAVLATITNDIGADLSGQRQALISLYNQGATSTAGRALVMYRLSDDSVATNPINNRAFIDAEYNRAFVFTQYAGYLRRNADMAGFLFWLGQVNSAPLRDVAKQHAMVCSFITATEYQQRFSAVVTHSNTECQ